MARPKLSGEDTFVVYQKTGAQLRFALASVGFFVFSAVSVYMLFDVALDEVMWTISLFSAVSFGVLGLLAAYWSWYFAGRKRIVLSADAFGVWVGIGRKRQTWDKIAAVRFVTHTIRGIDQRFLSFDPFASGRNAKGDVSVWRARAIGLGLVDADENELIAGLSSAAEAAGFHLERDEDSKNPRWHVISHTK